MKRHLKFLSFFMIFSGVLPACQKVEPDGGSYKVRIPLDDGSGNYRSSEVELRTVSNLQTMEGAAVHVKAKGHIIEKSGDDGKGLDIDMGKVPTAQFVKVNGVYIPADIDSLALTTAIYNLEKVKILTDTLLGNTEPSKPVDVIYDANVLLNDSSGEQKRMVNNAAYISQKDFFIIVPYEMEKIPLGMNGGVLAHEYGHKVFSHITKNELDRAVASGSVTASDAAEIQKVFSNVSLSEWKARDANPSTTSEVTDLKANDVMVGSINEGFADYIGYLHSGNPSFISPSVESQEHRDMSQEKASSKSDVAGKASVVDHDVHHVGAFFARFLYLMSKRDGKEVTAKNTFQFLKRYSAEYIAQRNKKYIGMERVVALYFDDKKQSEDLCKSVVNEVAEVKDVTICKKDGETHD